jgi:AcrR family transcriptional regulator
MTFSREESYSVSTLTDASPKKSKTRAAILAAALRVISANGITNLTLDLVAKEAGVSKGGLLYHFASKDELIMGLVDEGLEAFERKVNEKVKDRSAARLALFRAYVETCFGAGRRRSNPGMIAAMILFPDSMDSARVRRKAWQRRLEADGASAALAELAHLAAIGLAFADVTNYCPPDEKLRQEIIELLLSWR